MKERVYQPTNDVVEASIHQFEDVRRRISFLYPRLDLSPLDPFKVVLDGELVDEEYFLFFLVFDCNLVYPFGDFVTILDSSVCF